MHDTVACPSCHARLRLPVEQPSGGMTCPRCQALVSYEAAPPVVPAPLRAEFAPPASIQRDATEPELAEAAGYSTCPECGKPVEANWLFCPHCEKPLRQDHHPRRSRGVQDDDKQEGTGVKILLGLMGVLGGVSTLWFFLIALGTQRPDMVVVGVQMLVILGMASTGILFYRTRHEPHKRSLVQVLIGTFILVGIVLTSGCAFLLAVGVFALVACLGGGMRL